MQVHFSASPEYTPLECDTFTEMEHGIELHRRTSGEVETIGYIPHEKIDFIVPE